MSHSDIQPKRNLLMRLRLFWSRLFQRREKAVPESYAAGPGSDLSESSLILTIGSSAGIEPDLPLLKRLKRSLVNLEADFAKRGFQEGMYGKQTTDSEVCKNADDKVKQLQQELCLDAKIEKDKWKEIKEAEEEASKNKKNLLLDHIDYHKQIEDQAMLHSNSFGWRMGIFYTLIGFLLIIADIPLALQITREGFDLPVTMADFSKLFSNPWYVFTQNWEVFILATGIALCAIYIKIFWDEFLASPIEDALRIHQKLRNLTKHLAITGIDNQSKLQGLVQSAALVDEPNTAESSAQQIQVTGPIQDPLILQEKKLGNVEDLTAPRASVRLAADSLQKIVIENEKVVKNQKYIRIVVKSIILAFTVTTIIILGEFRVEVQQINTEKKREARIKARMETFDEEYDQASAQVPKGWGYYAKLTYIMVTLLFPTISGICLSKGIGNIHNYMALKKARKRSITLEQSFTKHKKSDLQEAVKSYNQISDFIQVISTDSFRKVIVDDLAASYKRGFSFGLGHSLRELGDDYFALAKEYRAKLTKRKIFESINSPDLNFNQLTS